jgi:hypothetical protein
MVAVWDYLEICGVGGGWWEGIVKVEVCGGDVVGMSGGVVG